MRRLMKVLACALAVVSFWHFVQVYQARGSCDSQQTCLAKLEQMCAKKGGVKKGMTSMTQKADGSKICSGDCGDGSVAFVLCP